MREPQGRVQEGDVEAHAVEGAERVRGVEGLDELPFQEAHVLRLARPHAPVRQRKLRRIEGTRTPWTQILLRVREHARNTKRTAFSGFSAFSSI